MKRDDVERDEAISHIEDELLRELEDYEEHDYSSQSSVSSLHSTQSLSTTSSPIKELYYYSKNSEHGSPENSVATAGEDDKTNATNQNILCSIPGFELFKETSKISSATRLKARKAIDSIQSTFGDKMHIETPHTEEYAIETNHLGGKEETLTEEDGTDSAHPNQQKDFQESKNLHVDNDEKEDRSTNDQNQPQSSLVLEMTSNKVINMTERDSEQTEIVHSARTKAICSGDVSMISSILSASLPPIIDPNEEEANVNIVNELQKVAEIKANEEQVQLKQKRIFKKEKRAREASNERKIFLKQSKAAKCLQETIYEFCRKKRSQKLRSIYKGVLEYRRIELHLKMKTCFFVLYKFMVEMRMAVIIQQSLKNFLKRKKRRQKVMTQAMNHFVICITLRRTFFFWKVFTSTMKMEERLMNELMTSTLRIQCAYRIHRAKLAFKRKKEMYMTTIIQKMYRGYIARARYKIQKDEEMKNMIEAAILVQSIYRGHTTRRRFNIAISTNYMYTDNDIDDILVGQEADLIMNEICTIEDNVDGSFKEWTPMKPLHHFPSNTTGNPKGDGDSLHFKKQIMKSLDQYKIHPVHNNQRQVRHNHISNMSKTGSKSVHQKDYIASSTPDEHAQVIPDTGDSKSSLMKEWNVNDPRVIKSMMRRKQKMMHGKKRDQMNKKLKNPLSRLKRLMKNVQREREKDLLGFPHKD